MTDTNELNPRIINMAVCTPPRKLKGDVEVLATFEVLMWPVHVAGMQLVRRNGDVKLWGPTPELRFLSKARPVIIEAAMRTAREAIDGMAEIAE